MARTKTTARRSATKKKVSQRQIYKAIMKCSNPTLGATAREIHRELIRNVRDERQRVSIEEVKTAINKAVADGHVKAPKDWRGYTIRQNSGGRGGGRKGKQSGTKRGRPAKSKPRADSSENYKEEDDDNNHQSSLWSLITACVIS